jgi:hypothetical protein
VNVKNSRLSVGQSEQEHAAVSRHLFRLDTGDGSFFGTFGYDNAVLRRIGRWTVEHFVARFKRVADADEVSLALNGRENTEMPWRDYGGMTTEDLTAIFTYLQTVPTVRHAVAR